MVCSACLEISFPNFVWDQPSEISRPFFAHALFEEKCFKFFCNNDNVCVVVVLILVFMVFLYFMAVRRTNRMVIVGRTAW